MSPPLAPPHPLGAGAASAVVPSTSKAVSAILVMRISSSEVGESSAWDEALSRQRHELAHAVAPDRSSPFRAPNGHGHSLDSPPGLFIIGPDDWCPSRRRAVSRARGSV